MAEGNKGGCCGGGKKKPADDKQQLKVNRRGQNKQSGWGLDDDIIPAKVVLLGESGVGKSSIALRFNKGEFSSSHDVTIGGSYL